MNIRQFLMEKRRRLAELREKRSILDPEQYAAQEVAFHEWKNSVQLPTSDNLDTRKQNLLQKKQELRNHLKNQKIPQEVYAKGEKQINEKLKDIEELKRM